MYNREKPAELVAMMVHSILSLPNVAATVNVRAVLVKVTVYGVHVFVEMLVPAEVVAEIVAAVCVA